MPTFEKQNLAEHLEVQSTGDGHHEKKIMDKCKLINSYLDLETETVPTSRLSLIFID